jgi:hypothetical protein
MLAAKEGREHAPASITWLWYSFQLSFHENHILSRIAVLYGVRIGRLQNPVHYTSYKNFTNF